MLEKGEMVECPLCESLVDDCYDGEYHEYLCSRCGCEFIVSPEKEDEDDRQREDGTDQAV